MEPNSPGNNPKLAQAVARFREIGDASPVMMWTTSIDGESEWFNRHWLEFTGQGLEQAVQDGRFSKMHVEDRDAARIAFEAATEFQDSIQIEYRLLSHSGDYHWFVDRAGPRFDETGKFSGFVGVCIDISNQITYRERLALRESVMHQLHAISERERSFLACAIHDGLLQDVIGSDMLIQSVRGMEEEAQTRRIQQIRETLKSAIKHGRRLISDLRPMILDEQGLASAVEYYAAEIENRSNIKINVASDLPKEVSLTFWRGNVFRIIQEALNNVEAHSGSPTATVNMVSDSSRLSVHIEDHGAGFDVAEHDESFGIRCMKDRAEIYGGSVEIESDVRGTRVIIHVPIPADHAQSR